VPGLPSRNSTRTARSPRRSEAPSRRQPFSAAAPSISLCTRLGGAGVKRLLRRCHAALEPGGLLLLDVRLAPPGASRPSSRLTFRDGADWAVAARVAVDPERRRLTREITAFRRVGRLWRRSRERHRVQLFRASELADEMRRAGFAVRRLRGYGRRRFPADQVGFLARQRRVRA